jgi:hypothetical protein
MGRRAEWQGVLNAETKHWSSMSSEYLIVELHDVRAYVVEVDSKQYQVEIQLLENTNAYVMYWLELMTAAFRGPSCL